MANVDNPSGFTPVRYLSGAPYNGATNRYAILAADGTATFVGDLVVIGGSATTDGVPSVVQAAATNTNIAGAVVGFEIDPTNLGLLYRTASTLRYCLVSDDPFVLYEVQEDSDSAALTVDEVGENCDIVVGSGNTTTGISAMEIDSSDHKAATAQIRVIRLVPREDNAIGNQAKWEVLINEHCYKTTAGT